MEITLCDVVVIDGAVDECLFCLLTPNFGWFLKMFEEQSLLLLKFLFAFLLLKFEGKLNLPDDDNDLILRMTLSMFYFISNTTTHFQYARLINYTKKRIKGSNKEVTTWRFELSLPRNKQTWQFRMLIELLYASLAPTSITDNQLQFYSSYAFLNLYSAILCYGTITISSPKIFSSLFTSSYQCCSIALEILLRQVAMLQRPILIFVSYFTCWSLQYLSKSISFKQYFEGSTASKEMNRDELINLMPVNFLNEEIKTFSSDSTDSNRFRLIFFPSKKNKAKQFSISSTVTFCPKYLLTKHYQNYIPLCNCTTIPFILNPWEFVVEAQNFAFDFFGFFLPNFRSKMLGLQQLKVRFLRQRQFGLLVYPVCREAMWSIHKFLCVLSDCSKFGSEALSSFLRVYIPSSSVSLTIPIYQGRKAFIPDLQSGSFMLLTNQQNSYSF